jgi:hypothetical protein
MRRIQRNAGLNQLGAFSKQRIIDDEIKKYCGMYKKGSKASLGQRIRMSAGRRKPKITMPTMKNPWWE